MREINFRAWDTEENEMLDDVSLQDETWDMLNEFFRHKDELILMQYTGLKDKNGKEIYEGDILEYTNSFGENERKNILIVKWSDMDSAFLMGGVRTDYAIRGSVVIGNIYENPEMIK